MKLSVAVLAASAFLISAPVFAAGDNMMGGHESGLRGHAYGVKGGPAAHVDAWHGIGSDHQADTEPGDTAADRHNFLDATAGKSGNNPTSNSSLY